MALFNEFGAVVCPAANKLGTGKEMVDRLTNLIAIFENPAPDFLKNRADGDDILGDAYEYLMRHFATESGKSKGQFYTPAEVSRIMAKILGIHDAKTQRVKQLAERYETPMPQMAARVTELETKVNQHPRKKGFSWEH